MTSTNHTLFEDYLRGYISDEEKKRLELVLDSSETEREEFDLYKTMRRTLSPNIGNPYKERELKEHLEELGKKYTHEFSNEVMEMPVVRKAGYVRRILSVAASFTLVGLIGIAAMIPKNTSKALAQAYVYSSDSTAPSRSVNGDNLITSSEEYYLSGMQAFKEHKYETAIISTRKAKVGASPELIQEIEWLMALSELGLGNDAKAKELLTEISTDTKSDFSGEAKELLEDLNGIMHRISSFF